MLENTQNKMIKGLSMFSSAGVGETYLSDCGVEIIAANELLQNRAELYRKLYPKCNMVCGDITDKSVFDAVMEAAAGTKFIIASPPCQGMSVAGKNRNNENMIGDQRNYLIYSVIDAIHALSPDYVIVENVPTLLKIRLPHNNELAGIVQILKGTFGESYEIDSKVADAADFGVPQTRLRAIIRMWRKGHDWPWPTPSKHMITVEDAIGHLPSLESGEKSNIKWHFARKHDPRNVEWMKHTPTGESAFSNETYYPIKKDGSRIKGFMSSYRRIRWDRPCPTITMRNDCIASQRNVHPGRRLPDGTYSDARVLTPLELMILDSLPTDWNIPDSTPELLIRQIIGESIPPLMIKAIVSEINGKD